MAITNKKLGMFLLKIQLLFVYSKGSFVILSCFFEKTMISPLRGSLPFSHWTHSNYLLLLDNLLFNKTKLGPMHSLTEPTKIICFYLTICFLIKQKKALCLSITKPTKITCFSLAIFFLIKQYKNSTRSLRNKLDPSYVLQLAL